MEEEAQGILGQALVSQAFNSTIVGVQYQSGPKTEELADAIRLALAKPGSNTPANPTEEPPIFHVPTLPSGHVARKSLIDSAVGRLLAPCEPGTLPIEILHGTGGTGKSTLAKALCYSPQVRASFEGVLWAELGTNINPISAVTRLVRLLGEPDFQPSSLLEASDRLRIRLRGRRMLLVLDNVWHADDVQPFLVTPECVVLLTTRRAGIMDELGGRLLAVPTMSDEEAIALLERRLGRNLHDAERNTALRLAESLDHLPLALDLAGSLLSRRLDWEYVHLAFVRETERLLERRTVTSRQLAKVLGCIRISAHELRVENSLVWERFARLGAVAGGTLITPGIAAILWHTSVAEAARTLQELQDDALLQRAAEGWYFHDLVREVALGTLTGVVPEGLGVTLKEAHRGFLADCGWSRIDGARSLPDGEYITTHLTWHLELAEDTAAIHELLATSTESGKCAWWEVLNRRGESATFLADIERASRLALLDPNPFPLLYRYSAMRSSLSTVVQCLAPAVLRSLVERGFWDLEAALAIAGQVQSPERASEMLTDLAEICSRRGQSSIADSLFNLAAGAVVGLESNSLKPQLAARLCRIASGQLRQKMYVLTIESALNLPRVSGEASPVPSIIQRLPPELYFAAFRDLLAREDLDTAKRAVELARHTRQVESTQRHVWVEALRRFCEDWLLVDLEKDSQTNRGIPRKSTEQPPDQRQEFTALPRDPGKAV